MSDLKDKVFRLKPMQWSRSEDTFEDEIRWEARGHWGGFTVERRLEDYEGEGNPKWGPWEASYVFSEYYDEGSDQFRTLKEAKDWCWEVWTSRILPHLQEVENP